MDISTSVRGLIIIVSALISACGGGGGSNIDPSIITSSNCSALNDTDNDGLNDCAELAGWVVSITDALGGVSDKSVKSDPNNADTDGDGLNDNAEKAALTDPENDDSDGDTLTDFSEITVYKSNPLDVDSDHDSRGALGDLTPNSSLFDGNEVALSGTSPVLRDTDGDKFTDYEEIVGGGTNPLIADMPHFDIEFAGAMNVTMNTTSSSSCTIAGSTYMATLDSNSQSQSNSSAHSTKDSVSKSSSLRNASTVNLGGLIPSFKNKTTASASVSRATVNQKSASFTKASKVSSQTDFRAKKSESCFDGTVTTGGSIQMGFKISNSGNKTFTLANINITVLKSDPLIPGSFITIGIANPFQFSGQANSLTQSPGSTTGTLLAEFNVNNDVAMDILESPEGVFFEVGSYDMVDEDGRNYAFINDTTLAQTGVLEIDYGNGTVKKFSIATNVKRNQDGSAKGITLGEALNMVGSSYITDTDAVGRTYISSVDNEISDPALSKFWYLSGSSATFDDPAISDLDLKLMPGGYINMSIIKDTDQDRIFDRQEPYYGTDSSLVDTDSDGLSDGDEVIDGWVVGVSQPYQIYSSPLLADQDADNFDDSAEKVATTDPSMADTDGDLTEDGNESLLLGRNLVAFDPKLDFILTYLVFGTSCDIPVSIDVIAEPIYWVTVRASAPDIGIFESGAVRDWTPGVAGQGAIYPVGRLILSASYADPLSTFIVSGYIADVDGNISIIDRLNFDNLEYNISDINIGLTDLQIFGAANDPTSVYEAPCSGYMILRIVRQ